VSETSRHNQPDPPCAFRAAYHRPAFYRYRVADHGLRIRRNRYSGQDGAATIGIAVVVGAYAYCVLWADPRVTFRDTTPLADVTDIRGRDTTGSTPLLTGTPGRERRDGATVDLAAYADDPEYRAMIDRRAGRDTTGSDQP
jgi:hypothetical protein